MDEERIEKLIEETFSTMPPVKIPDDLHFDAAEIIRLANREEAEEKEESFTSPSFLDRVRIAFQTRRAVRYTAVAAAFVVLIGVYVLSNQGAGLFPGQSYVPISDVEDDPGEVIDPVEYAGGLQTSPENDPDSELLVQALQDSEFASSFQEEYKGFGYKLCAAEETAEGIVFEICFFDNEEDRDANVIKEDCVRRILWKNASL